MDTLCEIDVCYMVIVVDRVVDIMHTQLLQSLTSAHDDPRTCPSDGAKQCTYLRWFAHPDRSFYHPHIKCTTIPAGKHHELMRFLLGCSEIAVNSGRFLLLHKKKARTTYMSMLSSWTSRR